MSTSKTARASMVQTVGEKKAISDEAYIKDLRNNIASAIHVTQESAKALLRAYDKLQAEFDTTLKNATEQVTATAEVTVQLQAAKTRITELEAEIAAAQAIFGNAAKYTEYTSIEALEAEAKNNHE